MTGLSLILVESTDSDLVMVVRDVRRPSSPGLLLLVREDDDACLPGRRPNGLKDLATGERPTGLPMGLMEGRTLCWIAWSRAVAMEDDESASSSRLVFSALGDSFSVPSSSSKTLRLRLAEVCVGSTFSWSSCAGAFCFQDKCFPAAPVCHSVNRRVRCLVIATNRVAAYPIVCS